MCMLCVEVQKQRMTIREVASAFRETSIEDDHIKDLIQKISENYPSSEVASEIQLMDAMGHYNRIKEKQ